MSVLLVVGNIMFIKVDTKTTFMRGAEPKYMVVTFVRGICPDEIYTESEILSKYPKATRRDDLLGIKEAWTNQNS